MGGWVGPGVSVTISANRSRVWVVMRGRLPKCMEHVRVANMEEFRGSELMKKYETGRVWTNG